MPRTLPWLLESKPEGRVKQESTPRKRVKREPAPDNDSTPKKIQTSPESKGFLRSSKTPPTSPARACPPEEFLIEGLDEDDGWVMVEDEFYAVAQSFTQHLHHAEYVRRKKEAKAKSTTEISGIERPTDGRTQAPKELQQRKDIETLRARQKAGLELVEESNEPKDDMHDEDEDDDAWAGTHLHGLMTSPRKARQLVGAHAMKSSTRAAAGFGQTSQSSNHDGVSAGTSQPSSSLQVNPQAIHILDETASEEDLEEDLEAGVMELDTPVPVRTKKPSEKIKSKVEMLFDELDELPEPSESSRYIHHKKIHSTSGNLSTNGTSDNSNSSSKSRFNNVPTFIV